MPPLLPAVTKGWKTRSADLGRHAGPFVGEDEDESFGRAAASGRRLDPRADVEPALSAHGIPCVRRDVRDRPAELVHVQPGAQRPGQVGILHHLDPGELLFDPGGEVQEQQRHRHRSQDQALGSPCEIQRLGGHPLEAVDGLDDEPGPRGHLVVGQARRLKGLRVAPDHGHRPPEVVDQHPRHRSQGGEALGGDQLLLVGVVLDGQGGPGGDEGDHRRLRRGHRAAPPPGPAEHQHPREPAASEQRHQRPLALAPGGVEELTFGDQPAGRRPLGPRGLRTEGAQPAVLGEGDALEALQAGGPRGAGWRWRPPAPPGARRVRSLVSAERSGASRTSSARRREGGAASGSRGVMVGMLKDSFDTRKTASLY